MEKEFNLSEKLIMRQSTFPNRDWLWADDIKEFIKRLKEEICCLYLFSKDSNWEELEGGGSILKDDKIQKELEEKIDKLAGEKLT